MRIFARSDICPDPGHARGIDRIRGNPGTIHL